MYNILVVDDEIVIADSIFGMLSAMEEYELDVVRAHSAEEGLRSFARRRVDLVVTDICMDGMDGIDMARRIRELWPGSRIIFLTGYELFDNAFRITGIPNIRLLLKRDGIANLEQAVREELSSLDEDRRRMARRFELEHSLDLVTPLLAERWFTALLEGDPTGRMPMIASQLDPAMPVAIMTIRPGTNHMDAAAKLSALLDQQLKGVRMQHCMVRGVLCVLLQPENEGVPAGISFPDWLWQLLPCYAEVASEAGLESPTICLSAGVTPLTGVAACFRNMCDCMANVDRREGGLIREPTDIPVSRSGPVWSAIAAREAEALLRDGDELGFGCALDRWLVPGDRAAVTAARAGVLSVLLPLAAEIETLALRVAEVLDTDLHSCDIRGLASAYFDHRRRMADSSQEDVAMRLKAWIDNHIAEDLPLSRLAEEFHYSSAHLSRIFRASIGVTLQEYILTERVEYAKALLKQPDMRIYEVAVRAGFGSVKYFNSVFKRITGQTPSEWRR